MSPEARRQAGLLRAILGGDTHGLRRLGLRGVLPGPEDAALAQGLQAYRGNAIALAERALAGAYPHLSGLLGERFASLAWSFWRRHPPNGGDLGAWGGALPDFLRETADAGLSGVAALEWALHQAERAPDAALDAASLQGLHGDPRSLGLAFRPGLTLLSLPAQALPLLGSHRAWLDPALGESRAVLVWRKDWRGRATQLQAATAAFMRSALAGDSLEAALEAAAAEAEAAGTEDLDFTAFLHQALQEQWLMAVRPLGAQGGDEECNDVHPDDPAAPPERERLPRRH